MKIFVAGGTGVLGWRAVDLLVHAGHQVSVLARSDEKAAFVESRGATPVRVSLFDAPALVTAVAGHDVVMNLATHIPPVRKAASKKAWLENDRIRTEGARNLVDAAIAAGATRYVQESICFLYADGGERWLDEDAPQPDPAPVVSASVNAAEAEVARAREAGLTGVVLRFGYFHAADSELTTALVAASRWGRVTTFGPPDAYYPVIHLDDAAAAVAASLEAPSGTYNVVDDEPLTRVGYAAACAQALGDVGRLKLLPGLVTSSVRKNQGPHLVASQRVSNRRFRAATGWAPAFPSAAETLADVVQGVREPRRVRSGLGAVLLLVLAFGTLLVGAWATLTPRGFYDSFPGGGRAWVAIDGPYNEHLLRDVGALNLALTIMAVVAAATMLVPLVRATAIAYLAYGLPHFAYHATHLEHFGTGDQVALVVSLGSVPLVAIGLLVLAARGGRSAAVAPRRMALRERPAVSPHPV